MTKKRILLWGAGNYLSSVIKEIDEDRAVIVGIVDSDPEKQGSMTYGDIVVSDTSVIDEIFFDHIVITVEKYRGIYDQCIKMGIKKERIIPYWNYDEDTFFVKRSVTLKKLLKAQYEKHILEYRLDSMPYELGVKKTPTIISGRELLNEIIEKRCSLSRFGDGEFEMIRGNNRPWFQTKDEGLGKRLLDILNSDDDRVLIAIAQNFLLDEYNEESADAIREYMFGDTRQDILKILGVGKKYYDSYVTRPYVIYKDRGNASVLFPLFQKIWQNRNVIIVEGEFSRFGVENDLLSNANVVRRIICPYKNAWSVYAGIKEAVLEEADVMDALILISLGPTATVLAFDLAMEGLQAIDIGQLDNEYTWWKKGTGKRTPISGKLVAEYLGSDDYLYYENSVYESQIIRRIC